MAVWLGLGNSGLCATSQLSRQSGWRRTTVGLGWGRCECTGPARRFERATGLGSSSRGAQCRRLGGGETSNAAARSAAAGARPNDDNRITGTAVARQGLPPGSRDTFVVSSYYPLGYYPYNRFGLGLGYGGYGFGTVSGTAVSRTTRGGTVSTIRSMAIRAGTSRRRGGARITTDRFVSKFRRTTPRCMLMASTRAGSTTSTAASSDFISNRARTTSRSEWMATNRSPSTSGSCRTERSRIRESWPSRDGSS